MAKITKQELLKLAHLSQLKLYDDEIETLGQQIQDVLSYAARVKNIAANSSAATLEHKNKNVYRADTIKECHPEEILALAPERQDDYFVVPKIIESK